MTLLSFSCIRNTEFILAIISNSEATSLILLVDGSEVLELNIIVRAMLGV